MQREYELKASVTKEDLLKFGFATYNQRTFSYFSYLYNKIIKVRFTVDLNESEMTWDVYDAANQKPYNAFYSNVNGLYNQVAIVCFERFNEIIEKMNKAGIISGEEK